MRETDNQTAQRALAVVIVTYNSAAVLPGLLDSLSAGLEGVDNFEVVVADNASRDNSVALAEDHPIRPRIVRTGRNGGYSAGINAGLAGIAVDADVLILNPDIRLRPGAAAVLVRPLREAHVGITVPKILHDDGKLFHSLRREPSLRTAWADALLGNKLARVLDWGECICENGRYDTSGFVDWASGAALAVSARARAQIGDWDESFFLYSEEVDYQRRARAAGYSIAYVPDASFVHIGGDYIRNDRLYAILTTNRIRDYKRHHGDVFAAIFRTAVLAGELLRSVRGSTVHRAGVLAALQRIPERPMRAPVLVQDRKA